MPAWCLVSKHHDKPVPRSTAPAASSEARSRFFPGGSGARADAKGGGPQRAAGGVLFARCMTLGGPWRAPPRGRVGLAATCGDSRTWSRKKHSARRQGRRRAPCCCSRTLKPRASRLASAGRGPPSRVWGASPQPEGGRPPPGAAHPQGARGRAKRERAGRDARERGCGRVLEHATRAPAASMEGAGCARPVELFSTWSCYRPVGWSDSNGMKRSSCVV